METSKTEQQLLNLMEKEFNEGWEAFLNEIAIEDTEEFLAAEAAYFEAEALRLEQEFSEQNEKEAS